MQVTICLDPGHGGSDPGAGQAAMRESEITLAIALAARAILTPKYRVVLTRGEDAAVTLRERVEIARQASSDAFVSIHVNAAATRGVSGYEAFVRRDPLPESLVLAGSILVQFARRWPQKDNRGLAFRDFVVVKQQLPACLVECFFISNPADRLLLASAQERLRMAEAIAWGCGNFVRGITAPGQGAPWA